MGSHRSERPEIRTFTSKVEVRALSGFKENNPLSKTNYQELVGDYEFEEPVRCCFQEDGHNLCRQLHQFGYVVRLKDGTVTIIGNVCAASNFDAEQQITKDRARHQNEKRRLEKLSRVRELLSSKEANMDRLRTVNGALKTMQKRVGDFMGEIGAKCEGKLRAMARDGRRDVVITGIKIRRGEEGGEVHEERTKIELTVGSLNGLVAIRHGVGQEIFGRINAVVRAYETAEGLEDHARGRDLENLSVTLSDVDRIIEDANQLLTTEEIFFSNDFSALPFLIGETSERVKVARSLLKVGKQKAKEWLQAKDAALRSAYGVNKLEW